jgi:hypothetical protein
MAMAFEPLIAAFTPPLPPGESGGEGGPKLVQG